MLITLARIFGILFTVLVIAKSYISYRAKRENLTMTTFWIVTWLLISLLTFFPQLINLILGSERTKTGVGTILGIGLIFIYFVIYRVYLKADRIEKQLSKLIRDVALDSTEKKSPDQQLSYQETTGRKNQKKNKKSDGS